MEARMPTAGSSPKTKSRSAAAARKWSQPVTRNSNAMTLERDVFTLDNPKDIALSLKRSAERSHRRKSEPYRSAMSMLTFYINRAGSKLPKERKDTLQRAKEELRKAFGRDRP
jgi:predicted RNA-binding protein with RPS1 domain